MENIPELQEKIKQAVEHAVHEWGSVAIMLLVALTSFGLGRLSATENAAPPVSIGTPKLTENPAQLAMGGLLVASRSGSVYYYPWCSGASKIAPGNQVWFSSEQAAQLAGYTPSKSCQGLAED